MKKATLGGVTYRKKLLTKNVVYKSLQLNPCPKFIRGNEKKIEVWVWDERIRTAENNIFSFTPSFQIAIEAMTNTRNLLAAGVLRK